MKKSINSLLSGLSASQLILPAISAALLLGLLDHITGYELSFAVFYVVPIAVVSWYVGRVPGLVFCGLSTAIWLIVDLASANTYSHPTIPFWNAAVRLGFFIMISLLLSTLHTRLIMEQRAAQTDGLTNLLNGRAFREGARKLFDLCRRIGRPATLAYIDLDNFKAVNDSLGHTEGDSVLKLVGTILAKSVRNTDLVGRLGGDEFAVILPDTNLSQAQTVIAKIHEKLTEEVGAHNWRIGFSIGVAVLAKPPSSVDEAIKLADNLMYDVKKVGKNSIVYREFS
ncbi:MAG: diguanylate cyclase [Desulfobacterales bacterium]|nr:MAG: diguanylate cyclase [Desulfobacterales bacterium]